MLYRNPYFARAFFRTPPPCPDGQKRVGGKCVPTTVKTPPQAGKTCAQIKCQPGNICKCDKGFCYCGKASFAANPYPPGAKTPKCDKGCTLHWAKDVGYYCHCGIIKTKSTPLQQSRRLVANPPLDKKDIDKKCFACPPKGDCVEVSCTESAYARAVRLAKARRSSGWRLA